jgi:hypothetical protein
MATSKPPLDYKPKARNDAYTGMLLLSLLVLIASCVLIYLDYSQYPTSKPPAPPKVSAVGPAEGGPAGGGAPKAVPPGKAK